MRKSFLLFSLLILACVNVNAQLNKMFSLETSNQEIVKLAVDNAFVKIKQSYRLQDRNTKQLYGRKGSNEFGSASCVGVKVSNGLVVFDQITNPWNYDDNYAKYKGKYETVLYKTIISENKETLEYDSIQRIKCNGQNLALFVPDSISFKGEGLLVDCICNNGDKEGWIIWVTEKNDNSNELDYLVIKKNITYKEKVFVYDIDSPNTSQTVVCGIYVTPVKTSVGCITFNLLGVLAMQDNKWKIVRLDIPIFDTFSEKKSSGLDDVYEITPISEVKKGKKSKRNYKQ